MQTAIDLNKTGEQPVLSVFYDGGCSLCSREIAHYRRKPGAERIDWIDITQNREPLQEYNLSYAAAMESFHVLDADGRMHRGAYAFVTLWSQFPGWRWLAGMLRATRLLPLVDRLYGIFARWRLRRRCADGSCSVG